MSYQNVFFSLSLSLFAHRAVWLWFRAHFRVRQSLAWSLSHCCLTSSESLSLSDPQYLPLEREIRINLQKMALNLPLSLCLCSLERDFTAPVSRWSLSSHPLVSNCPCDLFWPIGYSESDDLTVLSPGPKRLCSLCSLNLRRRIRLTC